MLYRIMCYKLACYIRTCYKRACYKLLGYNLLCCKLMCYKLMGSGRMVHMVMCYRLMRYMQVVEPTGILLNPKPHGNASFTMPNLQGIRHSRRSWRNKLGSYSSYSSLSRFSFPRNSTPPREVQMKYAPNVFTVCSPLQHPFCCATLLCNFAAAHFAYLNQSRR